ncbi:MAG TPA: hypothetical protein VGX76_19170, partial [Pirellulales bacterium]|nr:hypothetical protein [Pirellulales bacterium]
LYRTGRLLYEAGLRQRSPGATEADVVDDWMKLTLDAETYRQVREHMAKVDLLERAEKELKD